MKIFFILLLLCISALAHDIVLTWKPPTNYVGFNVYYNTDKDNLILRNDIRMNRIILHNVDLTQVHYFAVSSYNQYGLESDLSNVVAFSPIFLNNILRINNGNPVVIEFTIHPNTKNILEFSTNCLHWEQKTNILTSESRITRITNSNFSEIGFYRVNYILK